VFVFAGTLISFLMPLGLAFQSIAMVSLGSLLVVGPPRRRGAGIFGAGAGILVLAAAAGALAGAPAHILLASFVLISVWYFVLAGLLWRGGMAA
jgi:hypothetical protein